MSSTQISTASNLQGPNASTSAGNSANQYFTNLYTIDLSVSADVNDALIGFFGEYAGNPIAGKNLAGAVLYAAKAQNIDPMTILDNFTKLPSSQLNSYILAFLNSTRVPTSSLGVRTTATTSPLITRTILV